MGDEGGFRNLPPLGGRKRLDVRAFYLRLSSSSAAAAPAELSLVYRPAIGGPALGFRGRALPPASPADSTLLRVRVPGDDDAVAAAYASNDRVSASEGARFEVYAGKELAAEGVFSFSGAVNRGGWRVECRRVTAAVVVAEVVVLAEGGALFSARASSAARRCATRLEGIPEEASSCECGTCADEEWEVVGDDDDSDDEWKEAAEMELELETETVRWALEMGAWAVCVGVGLLATARRFRRRRALFR